MGIVFAGGFALWQVLIDDDHDDDGHGGLIAVKIG